MNLDQMIAYEQGELGEEQMLEPAGSQKFAMAHQLDKTVLDFIWRSLNNQPQWMRTLVQIGAILESIESSRPVTIIACLPRVEYAGLLVASGACLTIALCRKSEDWRSAWRELIGKRIVYSYVGSPYVYWEGILREPDPGPPHLLIELNTSGDFDRINFHDVHSVRIDAERSDAPLEERMHCKTAFADAYSKRLCSLLPRGAVGELCCSGKKLMLIGTKNRICEEAEASLPLNGKETHGCTFRDLLRMNDVVMDSAVLHVLSPKEAVSTTLSGVVVIEGSRRLSEHLDASKGNHRVILLGRNEAHYADAAGTIEKHWQQRDSDFEIEDLLAPEHIKLRMFC